MKLSRLATSALAGLTLVLHAHAAGKLKAYTIDVGTGLGMYFEVPPAKAGDRPIRVVYDTGKSDSNGMDSDLVAFLASPEIGLRPANEAKGFEGDVIDYFILSHPHEDHFNGAKPLFDLFDVRNIIESKQIPSPKYLRRFKAPAINEIMAAKAAGKDAHYYVVALPYPNGFDQPRDGQPYDEYEICASYLPELLTEQGLDPRKYSGKVTWPFGPAQVAQAVEWPIAKFMGGKPEAMKYVAEEYRKESIEVEILPVGTRFDLGREAYFTIVHGDTIQALAHQGFDDSAPYKEAFPYYQEADLNDGSVAIQFVYGQAKILVPGDTEGRARKPDDKFALSTVFGTGEGTDAYTKEDIEAHLRRDRPEAERLPIQPEFERYLVGAETIRRLGYYSYVTLDQITPEAFEAEVKGKTRTVEANAFQGPEDIPEAAIFWDKRSEEERAVLHEKWRERLFQLFQDLQMNEQKFNGLKNRFLGWTSGLKPRKFWHQDRFKLDWEMKVWTVTNLVQLAERIYYIDPALANIMAGFIMASKPFLDYVAPTDPAKQLGRGEKHMVHVGDQIRKESGVDVIRSDLLVFGHHGSFTSTSLGFLLRVDPNVGIISADDKSYSGSTLPDFSALFWNLNSHHPGSRATLHSLFFHADVLAKKRGAKEDEYAKKNRYSLAAAEIFRRRRRWPVPLWRTDFNDDLQNVNTLMDNIAIETDGTAPIWAFARHQPGQKGFKPGIPADGSGKPADYQYWSQDLISAHPPGSEVIRPVDPSGVMRTFPVSLSPGLKARAVAAERRMRREGLPENEFRQYQAEEEAYEEDWTRHGLDE